MNFQRPREREIDINLTPLIDVVFILLIFFMVSTRFVDEQELTLELPAASAAQPEATPTDLTINVSRDGRYQIEGHVVPATQLVASLRALRAQYPQRSLRVRADGDARHQAVVRVMDAASTAGFARVDIATRAH